MNTQRLVVVGVVSAASTALLALIGLQLEFAIGWGLLAGALLLLRTISYTETSAEPLPSGGPARRRGSDVSRLAWAINSRTHAASHLITRRVSAQLHRRLAQRGLDPHESSDLPDVHALIGETTWERLLGPGTTRHDLENALTAIERLSTPRENI